MIQSKFFLVLSFFLIVLNSSLCFSNESDDWKAARDDGARHIGSAIYHWGEKLKAYDYFYLIGADRGGCLDISQASKSHGARIITYKCNQGWNQTWRFEWDDSRGGFYLWSRNSSDKYLQLCIRDKKPKTCKKSNFIFHPKVRKPKKSIMYQLIGKWGDKRGCLTKGGFISLEECEKKPVKKTSWWLYGKKK